VAIDPCYSAQTSSLISGAAAGGTQLPIKRGRPGLWIGLAAGVVAAGVVIAGLARRGGKDEDKPAPA